MKKNKNPWRKWFDVVQIDYRKISERYRLLIALTASVAKWHPENPYRGCFPICGLCELFLADNCSKCPLPAKDYNWNCRDNESLFFRAIEKEDNRAANKLYRILYRLWAGEYRKTIGRQIGVGEAIENEIA